MPPLGPLLCRLYSPGPQASGRIGQGACRSHLHATWPCLGCDPAAFLLLANSWFLESSPPWLVSFVLLLQRPWVPDAGLTSFPLPSGGVSGARMWSSNFERKDSWLRRSTDPDPHPKLPMLPPAGPRWDVSPSGAPTQEGPGQGGRRVGGSGRGCPDGPQGILLQSVSLPPKGGRRGEAGGKRGGEITRG